MERLGQVFAGAMRRKGLYVHAEAAVVVRKATDWISQAQPQIAEAVMVRRFKDGELNLECVHAIALQECQAFIPDLLQYLQQDCSFSQLRKISVRRG